MDQDVLSVDILVRRTWWEIIASGDWKQDLRDRHKQQEWMKSLSILCTILVISYIVICLTLLPDFKFLLKVIPSLIPPMHAVLQAHGFWHQGLLNNVYGRHYSIRQMTKIIIVF